MILVELHTTGPMALVVAVGVGVGFGAVVFGGLGDTLGFLGRYCAIPVPAAGELFAGPMIYFFAREVKGHGVPEVMQAVLSLIHI